MKATGIVRRIDDLGRVVIPKEIRRTLRIRDGDPLEIYTDSGGSVIFRKYSPAGEQNQLADSLCEVMCRTCGRPFVICDRDAVVAAAGGHRHELTGKAITSALEAAMERRQVLREPEVVPLTDNGGETAVMAPVLVGGDLCGCAAFLRSDRPLTETEVKLAQAAAQIFARQMED